MLGGKGVTVTIETRSRSGVRAAWHFYTICRLGPDMSRGPRSLCHYRMLLRLGRRRRYVAAALLAASATYSAHPASASVVSDLATT